MAIPGTYRANWPESTFAEPCVSGADVLFTIWLPPKKGGELDVARAARLGAAPPLTREYADRKILHEQTNADPAAVECVRTYCERQGLTIVAAHWRSLVVSGPIARLIAAFGATAAVFFDANGKRFRHRSGELHVPVEMAPMLRGAFGLHQWPRSRRLGALQRHATPLSASDIVKRYAFPNADGSGQTIGVVQCRGQFKAGDFDRCMLAQGVASPHPIVKRIDDAALRHAIETTKDLEAALDAQIIGALAPGARIVIYQTPDDERGFLDAVRTALFDAEYTPSILSISYGWPEQLWTPAALDILNELFVVAALVGVSIFCSAGDNGAELDYDGKPHVVAPASSPFAHACGATKIAADSGIEREVAWERTGGGFSERFDAPSWQGVVGPVAAASGSKAGRGVPDIAAQEYPGYCVYLDGIELALGGTSAVAPLWAALAARLNQRLGKPIGFFAPLLYSPGANVLREVTEGNNGRFEALPGWNPCTGLGVPDGVTLEASLRAAPTDRPA